MSFAIEGSSVSELSVVVDVVDRTIAAGVVGGGGYSPFIVSAFPNKGLKYCTNCEYRRAEFYNFASIKKSARFFNRKKQYRFLRSFTMMRSPKIFEIFVTIENELPKSSSGISSITMSLLKSGVSSVTPGGSTAVARVGRTFRAMRMIGLPFSVLLSSF